MSVMERLLGHEPNADRASSAGLAAIEAAAAPADEPRRPRFVDRVMPRPAEGPERYAPPGASADAQAARDHHLRSAQAIEIDASTLSENGRALHALVEKAIRLSTERREAALKRSEAECAKTQAGLLRAMAEHIAALDNHERVAKECADVMRGDGEALLAQIRQADERVKARTQAILNADAPPASDAKLLAGGSGERLRQELVGEPRAEIDGKPAADGQD